MKERPILFSGAMVRAILDGKKTQTRRVVKPQPDIFGSDGSARNYKPIEVMLNGELVVIHGPPDDGRDARYVGKPIECPYGQPGDRLWVRETWNCIDTGRLTQRQDWVRYRATDGDEMYWRPSIFMPRWASRITLEVVSVRVERVQDISEADAWSEGVKDIARTLPYSGDDLGHVAFSGLWEEINSKRGFGWDVNPWVWVVEFKQS